jgi:hypothetical protein
MIFITFITDLVKRYCILDQKTNEANYYYTFIAVGKNCFGRGAKCYNKRKAKVSDPVLSTSPGWSSSIPDQVVPIGK